MLLLGELSLWVALLTSGWAAVVSFLGVVRAREELVASGRRAMLATCGLLVLSTVSLAVALAQRELSVAYVAEHTGHTTPLPYAIAALWTGQAGSVLVWATLVAACAALAARPTVESDTPSGAQAMSTATLGAITLLLVAILCSTINPFTRLEVVPLDGRGMNPQLQHGAVLAHPLLALLTAATGAVPFARGVGVLAGSGVDNAWIASVRRWLLATWVFLSAAMLVGMRWAFSELGWGGFWAWDPVQTASLAAWLGVSAALHGLRVAEGSGAGSRWSGVLALIPFMLTCTTTFVDRGAVLPSVHAFARPAAWGEFGGMLAIVIGAGVVVIARLRGAGGTASAPPRLAGWVSREGMLVATVALLFAMTFGTLWGLAFPLLSSWVSGASIAVGAPYFSRVLAPPSWLLVAAIVASVWLGLRDVLRRLRGTATRPAVGALVAHIGTLVFCVALAGAGSRTEREVVIGPGESFEMTDPLGGAWRFVSQGTSVFRRPGQEVTAVSLELIRGDESRGLMTTEERQYLNGASLPIFHPTIEVGRRSTLLVDVQVVLVSLDDERATMRLAFIPLAIWLWIGGGFAILGAVLSWWDR